MATTQALLHSPWASQAGVRRPLRLFLFPGAPLCPSAHLIHALCHVSCRHCHLLDLVL